MPNRMFVAGVLLCLAATTTAWAGDGAGPNNVANLTGAGYLAECQGDPAQCVKDAGFADVAVSSRTVVEMLTSTSASPNVYCAPDDVTDEQRRDVLVAYIGSHPEAASSPLIDAAQSAFIDAWRGRCEAVHQADDAKRTRLEQTTVAQFLDACRSDADLCDSLAGDASDELVIRATRGVLKENKPYAFCYPDLPAQDVRRAMVAYLNDHAELTAGGLLDGWRSGLVSLWPNKGGCDRGNTQP